MYNLPTPIRKLTKGTLVLATGASIFVAGLALMGYSLYAVFFDKGYTGISNQVEQQRATVSTLEETVKQNWQDLLVKSPFAGMEKTQEAELYVINPELFGQEHSDSNLSHDVSNLILAKYQLTQLKTAKSEKDNKFGNIEAGAFIAALTGACTAGIGYVWTLKEKARQNAGKS
jgi:hypothetical protein